MGWRDPGAIKINTRHTLTDNTIHYMKQHHFRMTPAIQQSVNDASGDTFCMPSSINPSQGFSTADPPAPCVFPILCEGEYDCQPSKAEHLAILFAAMVLLIFVVSRPWHSHSGFEISCSQCAVVLIFIYACQPCNALEKVRSWKNAYRELQGDKLEPTNIINIAPRSDNSYYFVPKFGSDWCPKVCDLEVYECWRLDEAAGVVGAIPIPSLRDSGQITVGHGTLYFKYLGGPKENNEAQLRFFDPKNLRWHAIALTDLPDHIDASLRDYARTTLFAGGYFIHFDSSLFFFGGPERDDGLIFNTSSSIWSSFDPALPARFRYHPDGEVVWPTFPSTDGKVYIAPGIDRLVGSSWERSDAVYEVDLVAFSTRQIPGGTTMTMHIPVVMVWHHTGVVLIPCVKIATCIFLVV